MKEFQVFRVFFNTFKNSRLILFRMEIPEEELEKWKKACRVSAEALQYGKTLIKKGEKVIDVCDKMDEKIRQLGAFPSFPAQISLNNVAAHYCGDKDDALVLDGVVKLDVGAHYEGFLGDTALTVDLTGENENLVKASNEALNAAIEIIRPGITLAEIGDVIEEKIAEYNFKPIRNLSGHGVGKFEIHTSPTIPNFDNNDKTKLEENQIIAIEPFATNGAGLVYESGEAGVFSLIARKPVREQFMREILMEIEKHETLPFAKKWLTRKFPPLRVNMALNQLLRQGIIMQYPPLVEKNKGLVSQAEHTILVKDKPVVLTRID